MAATQEQQRRTVLEYYRCCERDYQILWDLDHSAAMHLGFWEPGVKSLAAALRRQDERLIEWAAIGEADHVLDAGCGFGGSAMRIAALSGARVTGVTLPVNQAVSATQRAQQAGVGDRTRFVAADYTQLPFADGAFDVVWAVESVCHAAEKAAFVREARRVLRVGGRLIVADAFAGRGPQDQRERRIMRHALGGFALPELPTVEAFEAMIGEAGFAAAQVTDVTPRVLRSSRRLFWASYPAQLWNLIRPHRGRTHMANALAARAQYRTLRRGLCRYVVFVARVE